jgi:hypothetical protein
MPDIPRLGLALGVAIVIDIPLYFLLSNFTFFVDNAAAGYAALAITAALVWVLLQIFWPKAD